MNDLTRRRSSSRPEGRRLPSYLELIEDELRRRGGGGGGAKRAAATAKADLFSVAHNAGVGTAFSRASGSNAVVVKVLSYGAGATSARNVLAYQSKEEKAHDQDGREVNDLSATVRLWEREFGHRKGSRDVLRLAYELEPADRKQVACALSLLAADGFRCAGDADRTYAFSVSEGVRGQTRFDLALVIAHEQKDRSDRSSQNRISADTHNVNEIDARVESALRLQGVTVVSRDPAQFASGPKAFTAALHAMQRDGAKVTLSTKTHIEERPGKSGRYERGVARRELTTSDHKKITAEGKIVGALMQTRQPRDFMHLLLSGPANVDRDHFILAGRDFLREQFSGHRYAYAVHNRNNLDKHPHLHVIIGLRHSGGKKLNPNIRDFTQWRTRFAEKARERGLAIDRQKRVERAGPAPVKRWEWEMFRRIGATAPTDVVQKVISKLRDTPTAPKLEKARRRFNETQHSVGSVILMLESIAKDRSAPSTARELSHDLSIGLQREYRRLEMAVREGRDPTEIKGEERMLRSTPISAAQAKAAKETLATTAVNIAAKILNPNDRWLFEQATGVISKVVGLQLDSRVTKNRERIHVGNAKRTSDNFETELAAGDRVSEQGVINDSSNNRAVDQSRIARLNVENDSSDQRRADREGNLRRDRDQPRAIKVRAPQDKDKERSR